jgi:hypothetical protein
MFKYTPRSQLFPNNEAKALVKGIINAYAKVYGSRTLLKSFQILMNGKPLQQWLPEHGYNTHDHEHDWYHQFEGDVPAHHPPYAFDPETQALLWHNDDDPKAPHTDHRLASRPHGFHPIDYVHYDLSRMFADIFGAEKGFAEDFVRDYIINPSIDDHNNNHIDEHGTNAMNVLPNFNDVEWRRNHVGGQYDKRAPADQRQNRGTTPSPDGVQNPLINYSLNMGNSDHPHADQGAFIDGGVMPMWFEMGQHVKAARKMLMSPEFQQDIMAQGPAYIQRYNKALAQLDNTLKHRYLAHAHIPLKDLTMQRTIGDKVNRGTSRGRPDASGYRRGIAAEDHPLNNLHPLQLAELAPQGFYDVRQFNQGATSESKPMVITPASIIARGKEFGVEISEEDANILSRQPKSAYLFGGKKKQIKEGNYGPNILRAIAEDLGVDMDSSEYKDMFDSIHVSDMGTKGGGRIHNSRHIAAIPAYYAKLLQRQGVPADEALERAITEFRDHEHQASRHDRDPKGREIAERIHAQMREARGIPDLAEGALGYEPLGDEFRHTQTHGELRTVVHPTAEAHISDTHAPHQPVQQTQMPVPPQAPMGEAPQPTLLDYGMEFNKAQVAEITEAMEHIQLEDAKRDASILKMLPHNPIQLNSVQSVGLFAKDLGITSMDVHGLLHSRGDWHRIAKEWNVSPQVVKVVKVTFSGGV